MRKKSIEGDLFSTKTKEEMRLIATALAEHQRLAAEARKHDEARKEEKARTSESSVITETARAELDNLAEPKTEKNTSLTIEPHNLWAAEDDDYWESIEDPHIGIKISLEELQEILKQEETIYTRKYVLSIAAPLSDDAIEQLAKILIHKNCPSNLTIRITPLLDKQLELLGKVLAQGTCRDDLRLIIECGSVHPATLKQLPKTLRDEYYPKQGYIELCLQPQQSQDLDILQAFSAFLCSGECPNNFRITLKFREINDIIGKIIAEFLESGRCPPNLHIVSPSRITPKAISDIANALKSGKCSPRLKLTLPPLNETESKKLADALSSGQCPLHLSFTRNHIVHNFSQDEQHLITALKSQKAPDGLTLSLYSLVRKSRVDQLIESLTSGHCPKHLTIIINYARNLIEDDKPPFTNKKKPSISLSYLFQKIADALKSGRCPVGLGLHFRGTRINFENAQRLAEAMNHPSCSEHLRLIFSNAADEINLKPLLHALPYNKKGVSFYSECLNQEDGTVILQALQINHSFVNFNTLSFLRAKDDIPIKAALIKNQQGYLSEHIEAVLRVTALSQIVLSYLGYSLSKFDVRQEAVAALTSKKFDLFYKMVMRHTELILKSCVDAEKLFECPLLIKYKAKEAEKYFEIGILKEEHVIGNELTALEYKRYLPTQAIEVTKDVLSITAIPHWMFYKPPLQESTGLIARRYDAKSIVTKKSPEKDFVPKNQECKNVLIFATQSALNHQDVDKIISHFTKECDFSGAFRNMEYEDKNVKLSVFRTCAICASIRPASDGANIHGLAMVFSVDDSTTFHSINRLVNEKYLIGFPKDTPCILMGCNADVPDFKREVSFEVAAARAKKLGMSYIEVSGTTGINIEEAFTILLHDMMKVKLQPKNINSYSQ